MNNHHRVICSARFGRAGRRVGVAAIGVAVLSFGAPWPTGILTAAAQAATAPANATALTARVQLKGSGFEDSTGFSPELHGTMSGFGRLESTLKGSDTSKYVMLGVSDGKFRLKSDGRISFRMPEGTIEADTTAILGLPVIMTAAGPIPNPNEFTQVDEQVTITSGTGRFRSATGTMSLRGVIGEIPAVGGKRRFVVELSGEATLKLDPSAS